MCTWLRDTQALEKATGVEMQCSLPRVIGFRLLILPPDEK